MDRNLWSQFNENAGKKEVWSLVESIVQRFDNDLNGIIFFHKLIHIGWDMFLEEETKFSLFLTKVIQLLLDKSLTEEELPTYISFFKYAFRVVKRAVHYC